MFLSVCQGLQLCLEPRVVESQFLRLKLAPATINPAPTKPESMSYNEENNTSITNDNNTTNDCKLIGNQNTDMGGWSFLQSLASPKDSAVHNEIYVHPLVKSSASTLGEKSLELCTERLGRESGSEISDRSGDIPFVPSSENAGCSPSKQRENMVIRRMSRSSSFPPPSTSISGSTVGCNTSKSRENLVIRRMSRSCSFPPPLTSISGSNGVQVRSHREGGRLVLQAVTISSCHTYFHAERSEGRLRLCLLKDTTPTTSIFNDKDGKDEEENREEVVEEDVEGEVVNEENGGVEDEVEEKCHWGDEDMEGKSGSVRGEIGKGKLARPSSCKEIGVGAKGYLNGSHTWWLLKMLKKLEDFSQFNRENYYL